MNNIPELNVRIEAIDDLPVLIGKLQQMQVEAIIDAIVPAHHLWDGISKGKLAVGWLAHMLSTGDHRKVHVCEAMQRSHATMSHLLGAELREGEFNDDRLSRLSKSLGQVGVAEALEQRLNQHCLRYYALNSDGAVVRLDPTSVSVYGDGAAGAEQSVVQYGFSKDHRPDLKQFKVMLVTLDPLSLPLVTQLLPGNVADDGMYIAAYEQTCRATGRNVLAIGDCKMGALATRAHFQAQGSRYLMPLAQVKGTAEQMQTWIEDALEGRVALVDLKDEHGERYGQAYERTRTQRADWTPSDENGQKTQQKQAVREVEWEERLIIARSLDAAQSAERGLRQRLSRAQAAITALTAQRGKGHRLYRDEASLREASQAILQRYEVSDLLTVVIQSYTETQTRYLKRGRPNAQTPTRSITQTHFEIAQVTLHEQRLQQTLRRLGWRVYATNCSAQQLSIPQALSAYRDEWRIEQVMHYLKGQPLSIAPLYVRSDEQIRGLLCLLSIALRVLTLTQFVVRRALHAAHQTLKGLSPAYPARVTDRPSAELILSAFKPIYLTILKTGDQLTYHVPDLTPMQQRLLQLLDLPLSLFRDLALNLSNPTLAFSET
ncbi:MAG: IS1634 family transposase [Candidatus Rokuibacteriota bacterium]